MSRDPYAILMSEIMLRRTKAEQVAPVFSRFLQRFPDAAALANAEDEDIEEIVRPLGLSWRTPAFKRVAQSLVSDHRAVVPDNYDELLGLAGVGDYVAAAVEIFGFGQSRILSDTNTARVACRLFGLSYGPESRRKEEVRARISDLLDQDKPADSARALLDFASAICRARKPLCHACPLAAVCAYRTRGGEPA